MAADSGKSVTQWVNDLKAGDRGEAARLLWQRYFERLARLAQGRLQRAARGPADGEDVALRTRNLLIVAFARNGTVIPYGEFLIEPDFHRLGYSSG